MQPYQYQFVPGGYNPFQNQVFAHAQPAFSSPMDVVGEGDIATVLFPDGSTRYFFVPVRNPLQMQPFNPNSPAYSHPYWLTNSGIWFVRSISNAVPITVFNKFLQETHALSYADSPNFSWNHESAGAYQLKFHNNAETSTSDLFCFCPGYRPFIGTQPQPFFPVQQICPFAVQQPTPYAIQPQVSFAAQPPPPCAVQPLPSCAVQPPLSCALQPQTSFTVQPPPSFSAHSPTPPVAKSSSNAGTHTTTYNYPKAVQVNTPRNKKGSNIENMSTSNVSYSKTNKLKTSSVQCMRQNCDCMMAISDDESDIFKNDKNKTNSNKGKRRTSDKSSTTYSTQSTNCAVPYEKNIQTSVEHIKVDAPCQKQLDTEIWTAVQPEMLTTPEMLSAPETVPPDSLSAPETVPPESLSIQKTAPPESLSIPEASHEEHGGDDVLEQPGTKPLSTVTIHFTTNRNPKRHKFNTEPEIWPFVRSRTRMRKSQNANNSQYCSDLGSDTDEQDNTLEWTAVSSLLSVDSKTSMSKLDLCESGTTYNSQCDC